jgi:hypothetical protein
MTKEDAEALAGVSGGEAMLHPGVHVGHPTAQETARAHAVSQRLGVALVALCEHGMSADEARSFVAGIAWEIGKRQGDTWHDVRACCRTVENLTMGRAAKMWSLWLVSKAIDELQEVL